VKGFLELTKITTTAQHTQYMCVDECGYIYLKLQLITDPNRGVVTSMSNT